MRPMTQDEMVESLKDVPEGSILFVSYLAGRAPTVRAVREAMRAEGEGMARRHFFGTLTSVWNTKKGQVVMTVLCDNRDDERRGTKDGYRTFNPNLGQLLHVEVVAPPVEELCPRKRNPLRTALPAEIAAGLILISDMRGSNPVSGERRLMKE